MAPRHHIYASAVTRRDRSWTRPARRRSRWLPLWAISLSVVLTQALRFFG